MWGALLKLAPPVVQAVSVAVTAVFAILGLRAWRRQLIGRRTIEVAEGTLLAAYKVKEAMAYIRKPGGARRRQHAAPAARRVREPGEPARLVLRSAGANAED